MIQDSLKITDSKGFHYDVLLKIHPHIGIVIAHYYESLVGSVEYGRITEPYGDNDREWEEYEERLSEWIDTAKTDLYPKCKEYFDYKLK